MILKKQVYSFLVVIQALNQVDIVIIDYKAMVCVMMKVSTNKDSIIIFNLTWEVLEYKKLRMSKLQTHPHPPPPKKKP